MREIRDGGGFVWVKLEPTEQDRRLEREQWIAQGLNASADGAIEFNARAVPAKRYRFTVRKTGNVAGHPVSHSITGWSSHEGRATEIARESLRVLGVLP